MTASYIWVTAGSTPYRGSDSEGLLGTGRSRCGWLSTSGGASPASWRRYAESPRNVAPICCGNSRPTSDRRARRAGTCQGLTNSSSDTGPAARRLPTSIRSNGVAFHSEQSPKMSQKARMIVLTVCPRIGTSDRKPVSGDATVRKPIVNELKILARVDVHGAGRPRRRRLARDEVEPLGGPVQKLPPVLDVKPNARITERVLHRVDDIAHPDDVA